MTKSKFGLMGSRHIKEPGQTNEEYAKLRDKWYKKLAKAGFNDLEYMDRQTGKVLPLFRQSETPNVSSQVLAYRIAENQDIAEYYRLCRAFLEHANFVELFGKHAKRYKLVFELHAAGKSFRQIAAHFRGTKVPKSLRRPKASMFWSHWTISKILVIMYDWHRTHPEGLLLPEDESQF